MKKYYVRWGKYRYRVSALHPFEACHKTMLYVMDKDSESYEFLIPIVFCLSERGFDEHNDDIYLTTHMIVKMIQEMTRDNK